MIKQKVFSQVSVSKTDTGEMPSDETVQKLQRVGGFVAPAHILLKDQTTSFIKLINRGFYPHATR